MPKQLFYWCNFVPFLQQPRGPCFLLSKTTVNQTFIMRINNFFFVKKKKERRGRRKVPIKVLIFDLSFHQRVSKLQHCHIRVQKGNNYFFFSFWVMITWVPAKVKLYLVKFRSIYFFYYKKKDSLIGILLRQTIVPRLFFLVSHLF